YNYFSQKLFTAYERKFGDEPLAIRDERGRFYVPHVGESFSPGTMSVEGYRRHEWRYKHVIFIEKEGFFEALIADGFPERHDCALLTSKGFSSRAIRDLIDKIGGTAEPVQFFALHHCDGYGTKIRETLRFATLARPDRKVEIRDFGL